MTTTYRVVSIFAINANFEEGDFAAMQTEVVSRIRTEGSENVQWYLIATDKFGQENAIPGVMPTDEQVAAIA